jgi:FkbM family methyltransferase
MDEAVFKTRIRGTELLIDAEYEKEIGIYGNEFWDGISVGLYEKDTFDFLDLSARSGSRVLVDIGSATGCMVLYASSLGMYAIGTEPQNLVFEALRRNVALNPELSRRISIHHALVGTTSRGESESSKFFTRGANGPLKREILPIQLSLESLLRSYDATDKISVKIDIEGAEYPLLSEKKTLESLKEKRATVFLSFHPGFNRNLGPKPNLTKLSLWRFLTLIETLRFVAKLQKYSSISLLHSNSKLGLLSVITHLIKDQKDFVLTF